MALAEPFRRFRDRLARQGRLDGFSPCEVKRDGLKKIFLLVPTPLTSGLIDEIRQNPSHGGVRTG